MKRLIHCCLAHPCWSGISGIVAVIGLFAAANAPGVITKIITSPPEREPFSLTGKWEIESRFTDTAKKSYEGMNLLYAVTLVQTGDELVVNGEKDSEQIGKKPRIIYERANRTKFAGQGTIQQSRDMQTAEFKVKEGSTSKGEIASSCNLKIVSENLMVGSFSTEAGRSAGESTWRRVREEK